MNTSFEEKCAWIQLAVLAVIFGNYFLTARQMLESGILALPAYVPLFIGTVVMLVLVLIAGTIVAVIVNRGDASDERDRLISWKAESHSSWLLAAGVLVAITAMVLNIDAVLVAHLLLASLVLSEALKLSLQIVYYRRGI